MNLKSMLEESIATRDREARYCRGETPFNIFTLTTSIYDKESQHEITTTERKDLINKLALAVSRFHHQCICKKTK